MTAYVFKPSRRKNGKVVRSRMYSGRYRRRGETKVTTVALHVTDKAVAEAKLRELVREIEKEEMGIAVPKRMRLAADKPLIDHVRAYCADLAGQKRCTEYVATLKARLTKLAADCGWKRVADITAEAFQTWRAHRKLGAKTLNDYLAAMSGLLAWLQRAALIEQNPLRSVRKCETRGNELRTRRALTVGELAAVVAVAGIYRLAILTAYYTGLRRKELGRLEWGDIYASGDRAFLIPRAATTKNHESEPCYLPKWFMRELLDARAQGASIGDRIFQKGSIPSIWAYRTLLKRTCIPYKDDQGKQADFHALRHSLNTHLAQRSVDPQIRQEIMRHSEIGLTLNVYTDKLKLPLAEAMEKLPVFPKLLEDAHPCAHNPDFSGHALSFGGTEKLGNGVSETIQDEERRQQLALTDTTEQNEEKSCLARTRT
jgi:integrase